MPAEVETIAWTGQKPWHGLGVEVGPDLSPLEMLKAANLDWAIDLRQLYFKDPKTGLEIPFNLGKGAVRNTDNEPTSFVGNKWKPTQNIEMVTFLDGFVREGGMKMNTMGSLKGGKYVWALASINREFAVGGKKSKDIIGGYLLVALPHILGKATVIKFTTIRVVCWNTYSAALGGTARRGRSGEDDGFFKLSHSYEFDDDAKERAKIALGLATKQFDDYKDMSNLLAKKKMTDQEAYSFFCEILEVNPAEFSKNKDESVREPAFLKKLNAAWFTGPGCELASADHTAFGALNAVTFACDHLYGDTPATGLATAWLGDKAKLKEVAAEKLVAFAR